MATPTSTSTGDDHGIPAANEVACAFTSALMLGVYLVTFAFTVRWLLFANEGWNKRKNISWPMIFTAIFMFVIITAHTALDLEGTMDEVQRLAEPKHSDMDQDSPIWIDICKFTFANSVALAADMVLIYRSYVVYGNNMYIIAFPCFLWIGGLVCTALQMYLQIAHLHNPNIGPYRWADVNMTFGPGIVLIPFWGSTTLLNVYCTVVLIRRVYQAANRSQEFAAVKQFRFIARCIVESGLISMSISLAHFVVWFTSANFAIEIVRIINVPLIGIAFNLILIRIAYSRREDLGDKILGELTSVEFSMNGGHTANSWPESRTQCQEGPVAMRLKGESPPLGGTPNRT
ncbi:hypothetical protein P691DRAFT_787881 [Macrolepiota fuliginosa MF-IS2]|uniref:Uncharacterized protein n=1 Tax=Macrolepiota fuliginosa MF-IS2 TaxID=1400762 RepID=A0A9P5XJW6_9AGAR|nr:hypothetical protein P691DRAFT_787881 [Macrolepiota fuliginosa MF-IS2]